jgi:hypothetical protein
MLETLTATLAAEIAAGDLLRLRDVAERFDVDPSVAFRWMQRGLVDGKGGRVRLEALRFGRSWRTSEGALRRFLAALPHGGSVPAYATIRTPSNRERDSARAVETLRAKYGM